MARKPKLVQTNEGRRVPVISIEESKTLVDGIVTESESGHQVLIRYTDGTEEVAYFRREGGAQFYITAVDSATK